jgi:hypothetical protein
MDRADQIVLGGLAVLVLVTPAFFWSRLPDPVATHFGLSGRPDGSLSRVVWMILMAATLALCWVVYLRSRSNAPLTWHGPITFGIVGVIVVAQVAIVWANLDAPTWRDARTVHVPLLLLTMAAAWGLLAAAEYLLERR